MYRILLMSILIFPIFLVGQNQIDSSYLPIVVINTNNQMIIDDPRVIGNMGIMNHEGINYIGDDFNDYNGRISIELRGQSSMYFPKKSYSFETQDSLGKNANISLLGMPAENDWVLYGAYLDRSFLRNALTYNLYSKMGYYSPRFRYCNLVIDNEYMGVYLLVERIKRDRNRININELDPQEDDIQDISGGYVLQIDRASENQDKYWESHFNDSIFFQYIYPRWKNISASQKSYIKDFIYNFESTLINSDLTSLHSLYEDVINVESFIDYFIISELSKNIDAYRVSTYLYKDHDSIDSRLHIGPVWDFNGTYGNSTYCQADVVSGWEEDTPCGIFNPFWYSVFRSDSLFNTLLKCRWRNLRNDFLKEDVIYSFIDSVSLRHEYAINKDMTIWGHIENTTHQDEIIFLKEWISQRIQWLDGNMPGYCNEYDSQQERFLLIVTDVLGRILYKSINTPSSNMSSELNIQTTNGIMFYIYSDGTVVKKLTFK